MKLTTKWLKEHLDIDLNIHAIIKHLEMLGFELKKIHSQPTLWRNVKIVKIIDKETHPNADKLNIYSIMTKSEETLKIVCGDSSLNIGDFVPYVAPGCVMPSNVTISTAKIRGIESPGMLCSASELDLPIQLNGVLQCFSEDWGKSIAEAYEDEGIFEIELTPNRGDALSVFGVARILANAGLGVLKEKKQNEFLLSEDKFFNIKSNDCLGLLCTFFNHNVSETHYEIVKKLQLTEHTVTNLDVVDMTNYISHDIGQPMHVFDYDKIKSSPCSIENLESKEQFETLGNQNIQLEKNTLVFKSGQSIISLPGIIGGNNSKVDKNTTSIILETGVFKINSIQRRKLGIITSAAKKFEYGINPFNLTKASNAFFSALNIKPISQQSVPFSEHKIIKFRFEKVKEILGSNITFDNFKTIMQKLGFIFHSDTEISPPDYKYFDINTENCIVEEFAIYSNEKIESINLAPKYNSHYSNDQNYLTQISLIAGFNECKNISIGKKEHEDFNISLTNRNILNFSNQNYSVLRGSLIPGLLKVMSWHINNQEKIYDFFESGIIYGEYEDKQKLIFTAISNDSSKIQNLFSKILKSKNLNHEVYSTAENVAYSDNSCCFYLREHKLAIISSIKQSILKEFNIKHCYSLEIFSEILNLTEVNNCSAPSPLMPIYQDITFKLSDNISASHIINYLNKEKISYKILSIFPENNLKESRNLTIQFKIEQKEVLTKEQIQEIMKNIEDKILNCLN